MAMKPELRSLFLFCGSGMAALLVGVLFPMGESTERIIISTGYISMVLCCGVFFLSLKELVKEAAVPGHNAWRKSWSSWGAVLLATVWVLSIEPFMFKIIADELLIASNSQMMHMARIPAVPGLGNWSSGDFQLFESHLDKRPFLLPFLVSILHDLTGYRIANVFALNAALTFLFLGLSFRFTDKLAGRKSAYLFLILIAFFPVLAQGATSGNASILNLTFLAINLLLARRYYEKPSKETLIPLVFGLILLAQARYESAVYILPFGLLILGGWGKAGRVILSPSIILAPFLLVLTMVHHRYSLEYSGFYWQSGPNGRTDTFSFQYIQENLQSTWDFLFNLSNAHPNSVIVSITGIAGLFIILIAILQKRISTEARPIVLLLVGLFMANLAIVLLFNFGTFMSYATSRLSLPMHLFLALLAAFAFKQAPKVLLTSSLVLFTLICAIQSKNFTAIEWIEDGWRFIACIVVASVGGFYLLKKDHVFSHTCLIAILLFSVGTMAPKLRNKPYFYNYPSAYAIANQSDFIRTHREKDTLFVSRAPYIITLNRQNGLTVKDFLLNHDELIESMRNGHYQEIYFLHAKSKTYPYALNIEIEKIEKLVPELHFEKIDEKRIYFDIISVVHRLTLKESVTLPDEG